MAGLKRLTDQKVNIWAGRVPSQTVLYVPTGFLLCEHCCEGILFYGVRRSCIFLTDSSLSKFKNLSRPIRNKEGRLQRQRSFWSLCRRRRSRRRSDELRGGERSHFCRVSSHAVVGEWSARISGGGVRVSELCSV